MIAGLDFKKDIDTNGNNKFDYNEYKDIVLPAVLEKLNAIDDGDGIIGNAPYQKYYERSKADEWSECLAAGLSFDKLPRLKNRYTSNDFLGINFKGEYFAAHLWEALGGKVSITCGFECAKTNTSYMEGPSLLDLSRFAFISIDAASLQKDILTSEPPPGMLKAVATGSISENWKKGIEELKNLTQKKVWTFEKSSNETLTPFQQYMEDKHPLLADYFNIQMSDAEVERFTRRQDIQDLMSQGTNEAYESFAKKLAEATGNTALLNKNRPKK